MNNEVEVEKKLNKVLVVGLGQIDGKKSSAYCNLRQYKHEAIGSIRSRIHL